MAPEGNADAKSVEQGSSLVGNPVIVTIFKLPQFRNAGVVDLSVYGEQSGPCPFFNRVKTIGEYGDLVCDPISIGVFQSTNPIVFDPVFLHVGGQILFEHRDSIGNRGRGQVVQQPVHVTPVVFNPF